MCTISLTNKVLITDEDIVAYKVFARHKFKLLSDPLVLCTPIRLTTIPDDGILIAEGCDKPFVVEDNGMGAKISQPLYEYRGGWIHLFSDPLRALAWAMENAQEAPTYYPHLEVRVVSIPKGTEYIRGFSPADSILAKKIIVKDGDDFLCFKSHIQ